MTSTSPAEHDPFFQLLTEALRAGPGSAQWGEAVATLRDGGVEGADEYRLIIRAREDLESGRDFRRVTAGPDFTRKVLEAVEQEGGRRRGVPTATIVALLAGGVIFAVILVVLVIMIRGDGKPARERNLAQVAIEKLYATSFPVSVASGGGAGPLAGLERTESAARTPSTTPPSNLVMSHLTTTQPLNPLIPMVVECEFVPLAGTAAPQMVQVFVAAPGTDAVAEISCQYSDGRASVEVAGVSQAPVNLGAAGQSMKVTIRVDREFAIVEAAGRRVFEGAHNLPDEPRRAGVRFLHQAGDAAAGGVEIKSVIVAQAAAPTEAGR